MDNVNLTTGDGVRLALVNKKFLHSNATSHEWMFGAVAEILDNACDPDVMASQFWIEKRTIRGNQCLILTDNGKGMDTDTLHRMLSFGFSEKRECNGVQPIGRYGNGFKSGSMRLGKDAIVFTRRNRETMSVGMLSQTYLDKIKSETVAVPIVTWNAVTYEVEYPKSDVKKSLEDIIKYSIFKSEKELTDEIFAIPPRKNIHQGTRIVIYNLTKDNQGNLELDLYSDPNDILIQMPQTENQKLDPRHCSVSQYRISLRKYISILYLRPRMQVWLFGKKVRSVCMTKFLTNKKQSFYTPKKISKEPIKIEFGLNPDKDDFGYMIYNRNRLIQAFKKFNFQRKEVAEGMDFNDVREIIDQTIGVVELNCVTPNHIKQGFQEDSVFRNLEAALMTRLWDYCIDLVGENEEQKRLGMRILGQKDLWVQCDEPECQKWRRLPFGTLRESLPAVWYCRFNIMDPLHNSCDCPEEPEEDEPEIQKKKKKSSLIPVPSSSSTQSNVIQISTRRDSISTPGPPTSKRSYLQSLLQKDPLVVPGPSSGQITNNQTIPPNGASEDSRGSDETPSTNRPALQRSTSMDNICQEILAASAEVNNRKRMATEGRKRTITQNKRVRESANGREIVTLETEDGENSNQVTNVQEDVVGGVNSLESPLQDLEIESARISELKEMLRIKDSRISELKLQCDKQREELGIKDARISELERQLKERTRNDDSDDEIMVLSAKNGELSVLQKRFQIIEESICKYINYLWPLYVPDRSCIENDMEFLLKQAEICSEAQN